MSQTVKAYTTALWNAQKSVAQQLAGVDIRVLPLQLRTVLILADLGVGLILQGLVDAGVFTDTQVTNRINAVANATYSPLPVSVRAPDPAQGYDPPDSSPGA